MNEERKKLPSQPLYITKNIEYDIQKGIGGKLEKAESIDAAIEKIELDIKEIKEEPSYKQYRNNKFKGRIYYLAWIFGGMGCALGTGFGLKKNI